MTTYGDYIGSKNCARETLNTFEYIDHALITHIHTVFQVVETFFEFSCILTTRS